MIKYYIIIDWLKLLSGVAVCVLAITAEIKTHFFVKKNQPMCFEKTLIKLHYIINKQYKYKG